MNIRTKVAIISGASSGLGASMAQLLVNQGTRVYGIARNEEKLGNLKKVLGDSFVPVSLNISDEVKVQEWVKDTFSDKHRPDILINNAGVGFLSASGELSSDQWHEMIDTNLNGLFYLTSAVVPLLRQKSDSSHIINIGSILGQVATAKSAGYSATKFGVAGFSEALSKELRHEGIKVTCINPGSISTRFFQQSGIEPHETMLHPEDVARLIVHLLETPDNLLVDEITLRPLQPSMKK